MQIFFFFLLRMSVSIRARDKWHGTLKLGNLRRIYWNTWVEFRAVPWASINGEALPASGLKGPEKRVNRYSCLEPASHGNWDLFESHSPRNSSGEYLILFPNFLLISWVSFLLAKLNQRPNRQGSSFIQSMQYRLLGQRQRAGDWVRKSKQNRKV